MLLNMFKYSVVTEDGEVLITYASWEEVQELCKFIGHGYVDIFSDHKCPDESTVTVPCLDDDMVESVHAKETLRKYLLQNPVTGMTFATIPGLGTIQEFVQIMPCM